MYNYNMLNKRIIPIIARFIN